MSSLELLSAALENGKGLYNFVRGGEMYLLLDELAGIDGKVAAAAIEDAMKRSSRPRDQLVQAEGALRQAWEKYNTAAKPTGILKKIGAEFSGAGPEGTINKALLNAATTALTAAEVTRLAANPEMRRKWLSRSENDFDLYKTRAKSEEPNTMSMTGDLRFKQKFERNVREFNKAYRLAAHLPDV
jgi:hypothetical protein